MPYFYLIISYNLIKATIESQNVNYQLSDKNKNKIKRE